MFEHLFSHPSVIARHRAAPYADERERYLTDCAHQGYAHATLKLKARELLWIAQKLQVYPDLQITPAQLEAVASGWDDRQQCAGHPLNIRRTRARFLAEARAWLRFLGCWRESKKSVPFAAFREEFESWRANARGLSAITIQCQSRYINQFLRWYGTRQSSLAEVQLEDIDAFLITYGRQGRSRLTVRNMAAALRAFFRYAGANGWCQVAMAEAIQGPRDSVG